MTTRSTARPPRFWPSRFRADARPGADVETRPSAAFPFTTQPESAAEHRVNSGVAWLALMDLWTLADLLLKVAPTTGRAVTPDAWRTHVLVTLAGLVAVWCLPRAGFPAAWDIRATGWGRQGRAVALGAAFGLLAVLLDRLTGASAVIARHWGAPVHLGGAGAVFAPLGNAVLTEAALRLVPLPILTWLVSGLALRGRGQHGAFWVLAALTSLVEPVAHVTLVRGVVGDALGPGVLAAHFALSYALNFAAAACLRRGGLLGAVLVRLAYYAVWHVAFGAYLHAAH